MASPTPDVIQPKMITSHTIIIQNDPEHQQGQQVQASQAGPDMSSAQFSSYAPAPRLAPTRRTFSLRNLSHGRFPPPDHQRPWERPHHWWSSLTVKFTKNPLTPQSLLLLIHFFCIFYSFLGWPFQNGYCRSDGHIDDVTGQWLPFHRGESMCSMDNFLFETPNC